MNNNAQTQIYVIMIAIVLIVLGLALAPSIKSFVTPAMNSTDGNNIGMDCQNDSISNFDKVSCTAVDSFNYLFFGVVIFIAGAIVFGKIYFGGS
jgi:hypothetical protein